MGRKKEISSYQYSNQVKIFDDYGGYNVMDSFAFGSKSGLRNPFQHDTQTLITKRNEDQRNVLLSLDGEHSASLGDSNAVVSREKALVKQKSLREIKLSFQSNGRFDSAGAISSAVMVKYEAASKRIFTNLAPPVRSGILFCSEDLFCRNKGEYLNDVIYIKYNYDLRWIKQYRNIIRNETIRIMMSIDILVFEAKHLFGVVRTQIFFDLLHDELFHFGSPQAISYFLPNMAESAVRLDVTSFFEHSSNIVYRIMALLLGCPDSQKLQQMPEQTFISLLQSVIVSFFSNNKTKRGKSDKGTKIIRLIMVAPGLFVIADGEEIPEDILVRFRHGDEMVMNRFVDAGLEIMQASEVKDNRPIHSPYFPPDCRLFIYIPTENGSYWHKNDMQRNNRIRHHGK